MPEVEAVLSNSIGTDWVGFDAAGMACQVQSI